MSHSYLCLCINVAHQVFTRYLLMYSLPILCICFDLDMDFLLDNNMITAIVMINKLMHLVKLYYTAIIDCEKNV